MRAVALLLFGIHHIFADPLQINIRCANVIGSVGEELTLTCSVYIPRDACCIVMYKFRKTTSDDQTICREDLSTDPCLKWTSFSCPYTAYAEMTTKFKFFLQATCGHETAEFTLDIKEPTVLSRENSNVIPEEELTEIHVADPLQINVRCANVIGSVGEELTLTCSVDIPRDACCIVMYKFRKTTSDDQTICKEVLSYKHCTQLTSFSCPYTAYAAMTTKFQFFLQTRCGQETAEFTLYVKEPTIPSIKTTDVISEEELTEIHVAEPLQINVRCANVIGSVGEELTLTCSVDIPRDACCIVMYKFRKTTSDDQTICKEVLSYKRCTQLTSFSCPYTAYAAMTTKFKFLMQATCGQETAEFTLDVKEPSILSRKNSDGIPEDELTNTHLAVTAGCVLALTVCVAIMGAIVWMKSSQVKRRNLTGYLTGNSMETDSMSDELILIHSSESLDRPINF